MHLDEGWSEEMWRNSMSHEALHNLGVGDAYGGRDAYKIVSDNDDIMSYPYGTPKISNVHIYMMLEAHRTQEFMEYNDPKLEQFKGRVVYSNIGGIR